MLPQLVYSMISCATIPSALSCNTLKAPVVKVANLISLSKALRHRIKNIYISIVPGTLQLLTLGK